MAAPVDRHLQSVPGDIDDREISKYVQFDPDSGQILLQIGRASCRERVSSPV